MADFDKWKETDLPALLTDLDKVGVEIEEYGRLGLSRKKRLVEETREFKARKKEEMPDGDLDDLFSLVKTYQEEIDAINKRARFAEAAFAKLHRSLQDAPDPTALDMRKDEKIAALTRELRDLEQEFLTMKNQDVTVRSLQNRVRELEERRAQEISVEEHETRFERMYQESRRHLEQLQAQLLEEKQRFEDAAAAKVTETSALSDEIYNLQTELEHARERIKPVDHAAEEKLALVQSQYDNLSIRLTANDKETAMLRKHNDELNRQKLDFARRLQEAQEKEEEMRNSVVQKESDIQQLQQALNARPTNDDLQRLKTVVANVEIIERGAVDRASTDLEARLLMRQNELAAYIETQKEELIAERQFGAILQEQVEALRTQMLSEKTKSNKLEERLASTMPDSLASLGLQPVSAFGLQSLSASDMPSMDEIVRGQLEQQKERTRDLENDRDQWEKACGNERRRADMLYQDNAQLLEKLKYLNSYDRKRVDTIGADLENRYGNEGGNPFETFKSGEREKRLLAMATPERILVATCGFLMSIRITRMAVLIYIGTMHLVVFFCFYRMTSLTDEVQQ